MEAKSPVNQYSIALGQQLKWQDSRAMLKCCETLAFLVRDAAHITPHNFESCVHAIRTFVEGSVDGGQRRAPSKQAANKRPARHGKREKMKKSQSSPSHLSNMHDSDEEKEVTDGVSVQLLDLMHTLHTRAAAIFSSWAQAEPAETREPYMVGFESADTATGALWSKCWCPLLQGQYSICASSTVLHVFQA